MKRVIKFRAYTEISNEVLGMKYDVPHNYNDTVMQFTGLLDRHGVEIYEGDIVKGIVKFLQLTTFDTDENSNYKMCGKVYYDYSGFSLKCIHALCQKDRDGMVNYFDFIGRDGEIFDEMEIIGNEFENPEIINHS